ncbi:MAG: carboxypeptidase-like regulatory domain-containing protein, partial [Kofleriaceae bacterium]
MAVVVVGIAVWWFATHRNSSDTPATSTVTQPVGSGSQSSSVKSTPQAPAALEISVRDAKGPIAGATVRIEPDDGEVVLVKTDSAGVVTQKLPPGDYEVSASAIDHEPAAAPAKLAAGGETKIALVLVAGGKTLAGTVTDVSGGPISGVRIDAAKLGGMARPSSAIATTTTGADGKYAVTVSEGQLFVAARSADYAPQTRYVEVGPSGATADFALVPGGVIEGVVLDEKSKQPVAGAIVEARRDSPAMMLAEAGGNRMTANADGKFRFTGLRPGVFELDAHHEALRSRTPTTIGLGVAEQATEVQLLVGASSVIRGKVVDDSEQPVANATVVTMGERTADATTATDGTFTLAGVSPGKHMLLARGDDHVAAGMTPVELKDKDLDGVIVRVQRGFKIRGHVEPRQIAEVALEPDESAGGGRPMMMVMNAPDTTREDGVFELGPALAGKAKLAARCPSGDQGSLEIVVAAGMAEVIVKVTPGGTIAGRVVDGDNKPVAGATVMAAPAAPDKTERTTIVNGMVTSGIQGITGANGSYELKGVAPGTYRMGALDRGRPLRMRKPVALVKLAGAEKKTGVDLAVDRPNGVIKGVVTGPDGKPLADAWVSVHQDFGGMLEGMRGAGGGDDGGPPQSEGRMITVEATDTGDGGGAANAFPPALTDASGKFEITGLHHSTYEVVAEAQAGKLRGRAVDVTPDANLTIQALGVTSLSGTVTG